MRKYIVSAVVAGSLFASTVAGAFAAWVGGGTTGRPTRPLVNPHLLFELLTALPDRDSIQPLLDAPATYAAAVETTRRVKWPVATAAAQDCQLPPWAGKRSSGGLSLVGLSTYMDARAWLTAPAPKLRVALGSELVKSWGQAPAPLLVVPGWSTRLSSTRLSSNRSSSNRRRAELRPSSAAVQRTRGTVCPPA